MMQSGFNRCDRDTAWRTGTMDLGSLEESVSYETQVELGVYI